jgi:hypothetical protein
MIQKLAPDWSPRWRAAGRVGAPAPVSVTGGSHLPRGGFLSLLDYTFLVYGRFSLCKPDMWTIFGCF